MNQNGLTYGLGLGQFLPWMASWLNLKVGFKLFFENRKKKIRKKNFEKKIEKGEGKIETGKRAIQ